MIVDRLQFAGRRVDEQFIQPSFRFAGKKRNPHVERLLQFRLYSGQHRHRARDVEAADDDGNAGRAQRARNIQRTRKLVRLHADQAHHAEADGLFDFADDLAGSDAGIRLIDRGDDDVDVRS
jgi:hypothetical protein